MSPFVVPAFCISEGHYIVRENPLSHYASAVVSRVVSVREVGDDVEVVTTGGEFSISRSNNVVVLGKSWEVK